MAEQFGQTILATVQELEVCGEPQTVAATEIELNGESEPELERLEGMLVTFASPLTLTGNENLGFSASWSWRQEDDCSTRPTPSIPTSPTTPR
jgi:predicted extracellular nuclease